MEVSLNAYNDIEIVIEKADGAVDWDDCAAIDHKVHECFNQDDEDYSLTVSSAGLDRPFKVLPQYLKALGTMVEVKLKDGKKFIGKLQGANEEEMKSLIEEKGLFLRKDLRVADVAQELATNQTYVSLLVNNLSGDNFSTMIAGYRIRHAQKLMREHPEMVHEEIAEASGFASRTAFLRTFKAQTGLTPTEWKKQNIK